MGSRASLDRTEINHIAELASLSLTDEEAARLTEEIGAIVSYVEQLNELSTEGVPPTAHVQIEKAEWRPDTVKPGLSHHDALAQAPRVSHEGFAVPVFVENE